MPRPRPADRLPEIVAAAARAFRARGYRRTKMEDVARALGMSPGALYRYVEGKDALFHLVIESAGGHPPAPRTLPVPNPPRADTLALLRERLEAGVRIETLEEALASPSAEDPRAELESITREMYARFEAGREAGNFVEQSAVEFPELAQIWFGEVRHAFFERAARYVASRIAAGQLRPLPDAAAAARAWIETVVFFARHRRGDPFEKLDDAAARETVVRFVVHALLPDRADARPQEEETP